MKYIAITFFIVSFLTIAGYWIYATMSGIPREMALKRMSIFLNIFWWPMGVVCLVAMFAAAAGADLLGSIGYAFKLGIGAFIAFFIVIRAIIHTNENMKEWLPVYSTLEFILINFLILTGVNFSKYVESVDVNLNASSIANVVGSTPKGAPAPTLINGSTARVNVNIAYGYYEPNESAKKKMKNGKQWYLTMNQVVTVHGNQNGFTKVVFNKRSFWLKTPNLTF